MSKENILILQIGKTQIKHHQIIRIRNHIHFDNLRTWFVFGCSMRSIIVSS